MDWFNKIVNQKYGYFENLCRFNADHYDILEIFLKENGVH